MAKRSRGSARPGQLAPSRRNPAQRPAARPAQAAPTAPRPSAALTEAEAARAEELEAQILAQERAAEAASRRARGRPRGGDLVAAGGRGESLILASASREYEYVRKDLRHIFLVSGGLTGILLALWVLIEVIGIVRI